MAPLPLGSMEVPSPADASGGRGGRRSSEPSSPEFEFWMVRNPSLPQPNLLSADELFVDGVILPLRLLLHQPSPEQTHSPFEPPDPEVEPKPEAEPEPEGGAQPPATSSPTASEPAAPATSSCPSCPVSSTSAQVSSSAASTSKRWKDLFKVAGGSEKRVEEKERRRERKNSAGGVAELNINIWPFSRSRSAGTGGSRPKGSGASVARRVSSAPCSRSNSRGESSTFVSGNGGRRWASSPGRSGLGAGGGIHVGRASPVWQARRGSRKGQERSGGAGQRAGWGGGGGGGLNVNTCIGYGQQLNCRADNKDGLRGADRRGGPATGGNNGNGSHHHFVSLRAFFSKKVY